MPQEQAGFCNGGGTRDHLANLRLIMEKAGEMQKDILCVSLIIAKHLMASTMIDYGETCKSWGYLNT